MKIHEIMTPDVQCVSPQTNLVDTAGLMQELNVGSLPVCEQEEVRGIVTDRDIIVRAVAAAADPKQTRVRDVMTEGVACVYDDEDVSAASRVMEERKIRRVPVMNRNNRLVGIVSLGDLAVDGSASLSGEVLQDVSRPSEPHR